jgi:hypothetical protein
MKKVATTTSTAITTAIDDNHFDSATPTPLDDGHEDGHHHRGHVTQPVSNDLNLTAASATTTIASPDGNLFDPAKLRLSQDFESMVGVKKALLTVPVRKPEKQWWIRTHPDESWRLHTAILELKEDRETYLVDPALWGDLAGETVPKMLFTAINRQGVVFLWPVKLPRPDQRRDEWSRTELEAAELGMEGWVRVRANMSLGAYEVFETTANWPAPVWPADIGFSKLLEIAFRDRFVRNLDHPVVRRLRGEL